MPAANLSATLANSSRECWLALTDDESSVVGRGDTSVEALAEAKRSGVEDPILVWAPKKWTPSIFEQSE
jgi:hypothetical protein